MRGTKGANKRKVDLYTIGVDDAKILLMSRLQILDYGPGFCHFPVDRDEEYFLQLTAEKMITKHRRGFPYREWVQTRARNEALDVRVYSHAALKILNPNWASLINRLEPEVEVQPEPMPSAVQVHRNKRKQRTQPGFVNRW